MTPLMFALENPSVSGLLSAWMTIAYAGILSSGVGFTLQIVAQKDTDPTTATLIMSLESVFAAVSGCLFLNECFSRRNSGVHPGVRSGNSGSGSAAGEKQRKENRRRIDSAHRTSKHHRDIPQGKQQVAFPKSHRSVIISVTEVE